MSCATHIYAYIAVERLIMNVVKGSDDEMHPTHGTKTSLALNPT